MTAFIGRREFITLFGGAAVACPLAARAQQAEPMRRIGVLLSQAESDPVAQSYITAFAVRLRELGWTEGKNLLIDYRWGGGNTTHMSPLARGTRHTATGCASRGNCRFRRATSAVHPDHTNHFHAGWRSSGARPRHQPGASKRQH